MIYIKLPVIQVIQKSISFAWFSKDLGFSWTPKCDYAKLGFIQFKIRLFEMSMFRLNWLRRWENVYPNEFVPGNDHKFSSLRQLKSIYLFHVSKFLEFKMQCTNVWRISLFISCTHSCKDKVLFSKSAHKGEIINTTTNCPWLILSPLKTCEKFLELSWICID